MFPVRVVDQRAHKVLDQRVPDPPPDQTVPRANISRMKMANYGKYCQKRTASANRAALKRNLLL